MAYVLIVSNLHVLKMTTLPLAAPMGTAVLSFLTKTFISLLVLFVAVLVEFVLVVVVVA